MMLPYVNSNHFITNSHGSQGLNYWMRGTSLKLLPSKNYTVLLHNFAAFMHFYFVKVSIHIAECKMRSDNSDPGCHKMWKTWKNANKSKGKFRENIIPLIVYIPIWINAPI